MLRSFGRPRLRPLSRSLRGCSAAARFGLRSLQNLGFLINDLSRNEIVLDLGVAIGEAAALLLPVLGRHLHRPRHLDQGRKRRRYGSSSPTAYMGRGLKVSE